MHLRVLHVLDHSWPVLDGYSQRSRGMISAQAQNGLLPVVLTGPLHNLDDPTAGDTHLDDVSYFRTPVSKNLSWRAIRGRWPGLREFAVVRLLQQAIERLLSSAKFDLLHAHSPALCGLAAARAARRFHLPLVYEIRAFWEDAAILGANGLLSSQRYRLVRSLETRVVRQAQAVVGIAHGLLDDLRSRGAPAAKLFHVPNGVDSLRFQPRPRDAALAAELGVSSTPTLGFLGTLFPWEGVAWLVRAAAELARRNAKFKLLIVGDGAEAPEIRRAIQEEDASSFVSYLGRVPHEDVQRYYSVMDALVYPRRSLRITELVTPLKPLEAMALGKAVLGSSVGGSRELIESERTGLIFQAGDVDSFCSQALRLLEQADLRAALGAAAKKQLTAEKDWKVLARRYEGVYEYAIQNAGSR